MGKKKVKEPELPATEVLIPEIAGMQEAYDNFVKHHTLADRTPREMFYNGYYSAMFDFIRAYEERNGSHGFSH